ncbi:hypothetical protein WJX84_002280 [Apatococcus fuscideae]|uniref:Uncharacterized protein n=1 Tax=Apatococcus fuscideae TaxID=2026836 RepID=A0AAW1T5S2_9CHLO
MKEASCHQQVGLSHLPQSHQKPYSCCVCASEERGAWGRRVVKGFWERVTPPDLSNARMLPEGASAGRPDDQRLVKKQREVSRVTLQGIPTLSMLPVFWVSWRQQVNTQWKELAATWPKD